MKGRDDHAGSPDGERHLGSDQERQGLTRRSLLTRAGLGLAFLGAPALLAACSTPQASPQATASAGAATPAAQLRPLRLGIPVAPDLNPAKSISWGFSYGTFHSPAYAPILRMKPDGTFGDALATSWRFLPGGSPPNKEFEFTLRRDAHFSDGTPVNAQAVAGWLDYFSKAQGPYANWLGPDPNFEAADDWTVRIHLTTPTPLLQWYLSDAHDWGLVCSPRAVADPSLFNNGTYGAGPYMLDPSQYVKNDHYKFIPNPYYYDKPALRFSEIEVKIIGVASSMLQATQAGQLDAGYGDPTVFGAAESARLGVAAASNIQMVLTMNPQFAPQFADIRVRQAINHALDRPTIAQAVEGKYGSGTSEFLTTDADPGLRDYYPYDSSKATSLLAEAGYPSGFNVDLLSYPAEAGPTGPTLTQAVAKYLEAVGIQTNINLPPNFTAWTTARKTAPLYTVSATIAPTPTRWSVYVQPDVAAYGGHFNDPSMVQLYNDGFNLADPPASWKKMWELITKQAYYAPIHTYALGWYFSTSLGGLNYTVDRFGTVLVPEMDWL